MALGIDVTAQVQARHVLERSHTERQQLLEQAESASRAKDEFLAMLGHELRNPLSPIVTALEVMRLTRDSTTQKEQATIQRQVNHLVRLVQDLLDVSSITRGKVQLQRSWTDVSEIVTRGIEMARHQIDQRRHELIVQLPDPPVIWWGDADRLAQIISNLLLNAARYTPVEGRVELTAFEEAGSVVIKVRDNGIGMPESLLPHVFDMFFQGRRGVDRAGGGLGLGLALVRNLVAMHDGTAEAFSEGAERGSEFVVRLPLAPRSAADGHAAPSAFSPALAPVRVLIVDDNRDAADSLAELLRLDGHEVKVAYRPLAALTTADQLRPQLALLDIGLPEMDGHELARRFRERFDDRECMLVALTGYGQESDRKRSADAGFTAHLVKPVDLQKLRGILERVGT